MPTSRLRLAPEVAGRLTGALERLRADLELPVAFGAAAQAEADAAAARGPADVPGRPVPRADHTEVPFLTIDPAGSMDLDQALHIEWGGHGWTVRYAIADVPAFVVPGGALDAETHERGTTAYGPDGSVPLHPTVLSGGAASLLPGQACPAALWTFALDEDARLLDARVEPATVRSRGRLSYDEAQAAVDGGPDPQGAIHVLRALREVGRRRLAIERDRGGVSLDVPEQEAQRADDGTWELRFRAVLPVESWNAQISLLTGMAAARLMLDAGVGVLRTMPPAQARDVNRLRRTALALGLRWPRTEPYRAFLDRLDATRPADEAFLDAATSLFRGAGYRAFGAVGHDDAAAPTGDDARHSAIAAPYAHVTAPLRRLVDRYGTEVCLAACAGTPVPEWVLAALAGLPETMATTSRRANGYTRGGVDLVEAAVLEPHVGSEFDAVVVEGPRRPRLAPADRRGEIVVQDPAVRAATRPAPDGALPLGKPVRARLVTASVEARSVLFELV